MLRKILCMSLIAMPAIGLSGCSSMWSGIGNFSEYMAEKTKFSSPLRSAKTQEVTFETTQDAQYAAAVSDADVMSNDTPLYATQTYDTTATYSAPQEASDTAVVFDTSIGEPLFDADGNYIDTSPVPCPEGTYLTGDNTCMFLEQVDYSSEFTK